MESTKTSQKCRKMFLEGNKRNLNPAFINIMMAFVKIKDCSNYVYQQNYDYINFSIFFMIEDKKNEILELKIHQSFRQFSNLAKFPTS